MTQTFQKNFFLVLTFINDVKKYFYSNCCNVISTKCFDVQLYHGRLVLLNVLDHIKIDTDLFVYVQFILSFYQKQYLLVYLYN